MSNLRDLSDPLKGFTLKRYMADVSRLGSANIQDQEGNSLLHYCVINCNYPALLYTLSRKVNINIQNNQKITPLTLAIWSGFIPLAAALLQAGARLDILDARNRSPLYFAVKRNDVKAIRLLLDFGANPNEVVGNYGLLSLAAKFGNDEAISLLIEAGARHDVGNIPPLISCIKSGSRPVLMALIEKSQREVLSVYNERSILEHAIIEKTTLLPLIATLVREETEKMKAAGDPNTPEFPPSKLTQAQLKRLNTALERNDSVESVSYTPPDDHQIRHIYQSLSATQQESTIATEFQSQLGNDLEQFPSTPTSPLGSPIAPEPIQQQQPAEPEPVSPLDNNSQDEIYVASKSPVLA